MSYISIDEQCLQKIEKYVGKMKEAYETIKDLNDDEIDQGLVGYALAQCFTNLYETVSRVTNDELSEKLWPILKRTRIARNIAAHDYDSINWDIMKENCRGIFNMVTPKFLKDCQKICLADKQSVKDYTSAIDAD
jgi:uncharacterized protein YutE (UPF0331/DUF86 family)